MRGFLLRADVPGTVIVDKTQVLTLRATVQTQGHNIRTYAEYLLRRAIEYGTTKVDYVRGGEGRLKRLSVDKGLLREAESVQDQIRALLKCQVRRSKHGQRV
jgi:hypothetical protein